MSDRLVKFYIDSVLIMTSRCMNIRWGAYPLPDSLVTMRKELSAMEKDVQRFNDMEKKLELLTTSSRQESLKIKDQLEREENDLLGQTERELSAKKSRVSSMLNGRQQFTRQDVELLRRDIITLSVSDKSAVETFYHNVCNFEKDVSSILSRKDAIINNTVADTVLNSLLKNDLCDRFQALNEQNQCQLARFIIESIEKQWKEKNSRIESQRNVDEQKIKQPEPPEYKVEETTSHPTLKSLTQTRNPLEVEGKQHLLQMIETKLKPDGITSINEVLSDHPNKAAVENSLTIIVSNLSSSAPIAGIAINNITWSILNLFNVIKSHATDTNDSKRRILCYVAGKTVDAFVALSKGVIADNLPISQRIRMAQERPIVDQRNAFTLISQVPEELLLPWCGGIAQVSLRFKLMLLHRSLICAPNGIEYLLQDFRENPRKDSVVQHILCHKNWSILSLFAAHISCDIRGAFAMKEDGWTWLVRSSQIWAAYIDKYNNSTSSKNTNSSNSSSSSNCMEELEVIANFLAYFISIAGDNLYIHFNEHFSNLVKDLLDMTEQFSRSIANKITLSWVTDFIDLLKRKQLPPKDITRFPGFTVKGFQLSVLRTLMSW